MPLSHLRSLRLSRASLLASCLLTALTVLGTAHAEDSVATGKRVLDPGAAVFVDQQGAESFGNAAIEARWKLDGQHLVDMTVTDRVHDRTFTVSAPFELVLADGSKIKAADMRLLSPPRVVALPVDEHASRFSARLPGKVVEASFGDADSRFRVDWKLVQRDGSPYLREEVSISALKQDEKIVKVSLLQSQVGDAEVIGTVNGSPVVVGDVYLGFENPLSDSAAYHHEAMLTLSRTLPLEKGKTVDYSAVVGVVRDGQLRRDFNGYVERERAHPYRTFLHYNSWYDIGYFTPYTEAEALDRINTFGEELSVKRGVKLDSFLFDDGWDDRSGSWNFSKDFPHGFVPLREAAAKYGAAPGVWLSPWGGYRQAASRSVCRTARQPVTRSTTVASHCLVRSITSASMMSCWSCWTRTASTSSSSMAPVTSAACFRAVASTATSPRRSQLIEDIRHDKPDTFINLTTGTWASPFWLRYADSIWRDGEDDWYTGVGTMREQWITYRDQQTYENIVLKGPLFPINSLMLHGIIYAQKNNRLNTDPGHDFPNEVHSYFATGTQLQEMYITPSLLSKDDWDMLAEAAKWSRANAEVLRDTHWIGGDPGRLDVYGWASWSPKKAIVTLRNPDSKPQTAVIDLQRQLELPKDAARRFSVHDVWKTGGNQVPQQLDADHPGVVQLAPFEVLTLELTPLSQ